MSERSTSMPSIPGIDHLEPIGRGGFGTVYSGWQEALHRRVAVKILNSAAGDAEATARLEREGMADHRRRRGARCRHPRRGVRPAGRPS